MTKQNNNSKKGFTIIEVVLVLAIAGLIFLMVFVALPALQRSQRDTARRNDISRVSTALIQYKTNNQNALPAAVTSAWVGSSVFGSGTSCNSACQFVQKYMNSANSTTNTFKDPDGTYYSVKIISPTGSTGAVQEAPTSMDHIIRIYISAKCDGEQVRKTSNASQFAVAYRLEGAGVYCVDNQ